MTGLNTDFESKKGEISRSTILDDFLIDEIFESTCFNFETNEMFRCVPSDISAGPFILKSQLVSKLLSGHPSYDS